jgi:PAS domain S-box-containing protein
VTTKISLQAKVSVFITLIIVVISVLSTYLFTTQYKQSKEKGRIERGSALSYALSKAAEEGLLNENLDLLQKASSVVKAPDVRLAQVYLSIWEAVDAYPLGKLKEQPHPQAVEHFKSSEGPFYLRIKEGYDFYTPVYFRASESSSPVIIGFARLVLSSAAIQQEIQQIVIKNIIVSVIITLLAIVFINILIRRLVIKPVMTLHESVLLFKAGILPEAEIPAGSSDEIGDLSIEFYRMCRTIKEEEKMLVASDKRIRSLFERVEHAVFRLDKSGAIIEKNRRFIELFGNITWLCDMLMEDLDAAECLSKAVPEKAMHLEKKAVGKKGEELVISLALYPDTDSSGSITGFDGYLLDVTEKKRLEERLIRSQKMEAVGTLAGGMAHDFNNLLTAILGYSEIIQMKSKEGDPFWRPATIIYDAAKRGADLSKMILSATRKEKIETRPVNINDIVRNSIELLRRSIPKNIEIVTILADEIPHVNADPSQLQQVIMNLAVNARDAMPEGGKLLLETAEAGKEKNAAAMQTVSSDFVKLSISDTGNGISKETQKRIFDPFFTTKDMGKGTGLGLYIVHSIISNHGGYINLYSEPFKGTKFNIYLPTTDSMDNEKTVDAEDLRGAGTVLVIDDESIVRELCKDLLEPLGYTVLLAEDGYSGIKAFREMKDGIALVILDMIMPGMGGNEVYQALKAIRKDVAVLLCSGYSENGLAGIDNLLKHGTSGFIGKPFSRRSIARAVKEALSK